MNPSSQLQADADAVAQKLSEIIAGYTSPATHLRDGMVYATSNGGKKLRAALVMGAARLASGSDVIDTGAARTAAALEAIHAYSLVHDDLPAMDDAQLRRGYACTHVHFDEATAILVGDALQTMAFEILADPQTHSDAAVRIELVAALAKASGLDGMAGGQMLDLEAEQGGFDLEAVKAMQAMKTGALIRAAALCGGIVGGGGDRLLAALDGFSRNLGLAFQIADDLLDYQGDENTLGKPVGQDAARGKGSFVTFLGLDEAGRAASKLVDEANAQLAPWGEAAAYLRSLAAFAIARKS